MANKQTALKIGILQTGRLPDELRKSHGDFDDMFVRLLGGEGFTFEIYPVVDGEFPADAVSCDGWLITGSRHGAYEDHDWIPPLEELIREIVAAQIPLVGVCFGHQIIAQALGGKVEKFSGGWSVGADRYEMAGFPDAVSLLAFYQDQVVELPDDTKVIGSSPFCKYAALVYGDTVFTIQPHPEFSAGFMADLIDARRGVLPAHVVDRGLASLTAQPDSKLVADHIKALFRSTKN